MTRARLFVLGASMLLLARPLSAQTSWGVVATTSNEIVFCDAQRDRVWKLDTSGRLSPVLTDTRCRTAVLAADGSVYGESVSAGTNVDASSGVSLSSAVGVWRLAGTALRWPQAPSLRPDPSVWVVFDREGRSFSWNGAIPRSTLSQIMRREPTGTAVVAAGGRWGQRDGMGDSAMFGRVAGVALAPDNSLLIADSGNLRRMSPLGQVTTESVGTFSDPETGLVGQIGLWDRTMGVASHTDGSALVVDYPQRRILHIARNGLAQELWRSRWGWRPTGIAALQSGFYIMEEWPVPALAADLLGTPRILLLKPDGSTQRIVSVSSWVVRGLTLLSLVILFSALRRRRPRV
jgi:hypothetical protein